MTKLGELWNNASKAVKDKYKKIADDDKDRYIKECEKAGVPIKKTKPAAATKAKGKGKKAKAKDAADPENEEDQDDEEEE